MTVFQDSSSNISMSSLVILAASVFEIIVQINRQDTQKNGGKTQTTVGVG